MSSINDTFILQSLIPRLLNDAIRSKQKVFTIQKLFEDIKLRTEIGQMLDLHTVNQSDQTINYKFFDALYYYYSYFSLEYYMEIITNKTAYYTIFLPVYIGLVLTEKEDAYQSTMIQELCLVLGRFFQIRDDYLDVFADASVLGKEGTDIQEGKCSWVVLKVMTLCNDTDLEELKQNYGKDDIAKVNRVKEIFSKYDMKSHFETCKKESLDRCHSILQSDHFPMPSLIPLFSLLISKLFLFIVWKTNK